MNLPQEPRIAIIGLGYVGLPLAVEFGKQLPTLGFDISAARIDELAAGTDSTREYSADELRAANQLHFSSDAEALRDCDVYIITVPTPVDSSNQPDLSCLRSASELVGAVLATDNLVIYESTVYPGCTEEECVPVLERVSGLGYNRDFYCGYSPERINPGDKERRLKDVVKVTSGSTEAAAELVDALYRRIVVAGTHRVSSIRVAEAAKVIENTQRDINIALVNELAVIFNRLGIDTMEVLEAAGSKWNFLPFRPGLVGGHCIGVDPYYLTHKAQQAGYHPEVILSGRRINDGMGTYIANAVMKLMTQRMIHIVGANILIMGVTFKENCPDLRNTRVVDVVRELQSYHARVDIYDPWVSNEELEAEYGLRLVCEPPVNHYDAIVLCVAHEQFKVLGGEEIRAFGRDRHVLYDVKHILPKAAVDARL